MGAIDPTNYKPDVLEHVYQPWDIELRQYSDGGYFARVVELPGCMTEADSATEAIEALEEARAEWIATALEDGQRIPEPLDTQDFSGKIFIRTSPELHRKVAGMAARQGVSMSQWVSEVLSEAVGSHSVVDDIDSREVKILVASASERVEKALMSALRAAVEDAKKRQADAEDERRMTAG